MSVTKVVQPDGLQLVLAELTSGRREGVCEPPGEALRMSVSTLQVAEDQRVVASKLKRHVGQGLAVCPEVPKGALVNIDNPPLARFGRTLDQVLPLALHSHDPN